MHNSLYNSVTRAWRRYKELYRAKNYKYTKNEMMNDRIPVFTENYNKDIEEGLELLLSFVRKIMLKRGKNA